MKKYSFAELKSDARASLAGRWPFVTGMFLIELVINFALQSLAESAFPIQISGGVSILGLICMVLISLISVILSMGASFFYLNVCRGQQYQVSDLFYGFTHQPERIVVWYFALFGLTLLFSALPVGLLVMGLLSDNSLWIILCAAAAVLCMAGLFSIMLRYAMFPYLYADTPWKSTRELMQESSELMRGQKIRYLLLQLSFIGLYLLAILTFGIGLVWLSPYISATNTHFYLRLRSNHSKYSYSC